MDELKCFFFWNGNTVFFKNGQQVPELQKAWIKLYFEFLKKQGINPLVVEFNFPDGMKAKAFETRKGDYGWELSEKT